MKSARPAALVGTNAAGAPGSYYLFGWIVKEVRIQMDYCGIDQYYSSWQPGGPELWTERIAEIYATTGVFCLPGGREAAVKSLARPVLQQ